jgi:hypothetical protein
VVEVCYQIAEKGTLAEIAQRLGRKALEELAGVAGVAKPDTLLAGVLLGSL